MLLVSDLHFGYLEQSAVELFIEAVQDDPDRVVVIAGDVTSKSTDEEYEQAKQFVRRLLDLGIKVVATLGNHGTVLVNSRLILM